MTKIFAMIIAVSGLVAADAAAATQLAIPLSYHGKWASDAVSCRESEPTTISAQRIVLPDEDLRVMSVRATRRRGHIVRVRSLEASKIAAHQDYENLGLALIGRKLELSFPQTNAGAQRWVLERCR